MDHPIIWTIDKEKLYSLIASGMSERKAAEMLGYDDHKFALLLVNHADEIL